MAITQGSPLPDITQTTTRSDTAPDYYTQYLSQLSSAGQTAMGRSPTEMVAGLTPQQLTGYQQVGEVAGAYKPGLEAAGESAAKAAAGITPERISGLMNPYTSQVVDEMARLSQQNLQRNVLPTLKAGFVGTGGLGGQRYAGALGQALADTQSNLTGQQFGALSKGYSEALKAALDEAQLSNEAAKTQNLLAKSEQELGLTGAGALTKAGAEQQAYQQSLLDAPLKTATGAQALLRGFTIPTTQTEKFVGPKAGSYQTSDLAQIMGVLNMIGSANGGAGLSKVAQFGGGLLDQLKKSLGSDFSVSEVANTSVPGDASGAYGWKYYDDGTAISPNGEYYYQGDLVWSPSGEGG